MLIVHAEQTDRGLVRPRNEDTLLADPLHQVFAVFDGVGGQAGGAEASKIAANQLATVVGAHRDLLESFAAGHVSVHELADLLETAIHQASAAIQRYSREHPELIGMATTAAVLLISGSHAFVAHVGDSRVYLLRQGVLHPLTEDHRVMSDLRRRGRAPEGHIGQVFQDALTRALGVMNSARADLLDLETLPGDRFVLCTDGVHGVLEDETLQSLLAAKEPEDAVSRVIQAVHEDGAPDNASLVVVDVRDDDTAERAQRVRRQLEALHGVTVFRYLPFADLVRVAGIASERELKAGEDVFLEGELGESLFVILSGRASVLKSGIEIARLVPGGHFGEMSLIERSPRTATVRATTPLSLLVIERSNFFALLGEDATAVKLLWGLVRMMNSRLRATSDELTALKVTRLL
ncbi:MAG: cyclic nucleotide-binding domain-containing protein [Myxococcota bacterium]